MAAHADNPDTTTERLPLIAYRLDRKAPLPPIVPATSKRAWMNETNKNFAQRCLPLLIANQAGWFLLNTEPFRVTWDGRTSLDAITVDPLRENSGPLLASSVFGYGIVTWTVNYLFRTPPGYNLSVRGPANMPKDGISALEGIVETDWAVANFTMNWKLTRPNHPVTFQADEPFCMIAPTRRYELEGVEPRVLPIEKDPALAAEWKEFHRRRVMMRGLRNLAYQKATDPATVKVPYERHYLEGTTPTGTKAPDHQKKLSLKRFDASAIESELD